MRPRLPLVLLLAATLATQAHGATRSGCEGWRATLGAADERTDKRMGLKLDFDAATAAWDIPPDLDPNAPPPPRRAGPDTEANLRPHFTPVQPMAELQCSVFAARFKLTKTDVSPERTCRAVTNAHRFQGECVDASGGKLMLRGALNRGEP